MGLNQADAAALAGLNRTAQVRYEKGERYPDSRYLQALAEAGWDVHYVLTGRRQVALPDNENALLAAYRGASPALRTAALGVLSAGASSDRGSRAGVHFGGDNHGQVLSAETIRQDGLTINVGSRAKRSKRPK